eukprot:gnl/Trimastix_PCT/3398.p1 GENE.gnl/Trimastix_PCT/3398~~gnl/Trimastix_PCT/3398.p1  ORF type:complete len:551 (+),score=117.78 gnl/Trimastix_PCT/3398:92-1744(+)
MASSQSNYQLLQTEPVTLHADVTDRKDSAITYSFNQGKKRIVNHKGWYNIRMRGAFLTKKKLYLQDWVHTLVNSPWWRLGILFLLSYSFAFFIFGVFYYIGGVHVRGDVPTSMPFWNCICFSIQTIMTIGFGEMHPKGVYGYCVVWFQSIFGVFLDACWMGIIFAKLSRPDPSRRAMLYSKCAVVTQFNEVPSMLFRFVNIRKHQFAEFHLHVYLAYWHITVEGYKELAFEELEIANPIHPVLSIPWTVVHHIDESSPLFRHTRASLAQSDAEIIVVADGAVPTTSLTAQFRWSYTHKDIHWNRKFVEVLSVKPDGTHIVDIGKFSDTVPEEPLSFSQRHTAGPCSPRVHYSPQPASNAPLPLGLSINGHAHTHTDMHTHMHSTSPSSPLAVATSTTQDSVGNPSVSFFATLAPKGGEGDDKSEAAMAPPQGIPRTPGGPSPLVSAPSLTHTPASTREHSTPPHTAPPGPHAPALTPPHSPPTLRSARSRRTAPSKSLDFPRDRTRESQHRTQERPQKGSRRGSASEVPLAQSVPQSEGYHDLLAFPKEK